MMPDYTDNPQYREAMDVFGKEEFAIWYCENYPYGGINIKTAYTLWVAEQWGL